MHRHVKKQRRLQWLGYSSDLVPFGRIQLVVVDQHDGHVDDGLGPRVCDSHLEGEGRPQPADVCLETPL